MKPFSVQRPDCRVLPSWPFCLGSPNHVNYGGTVVLWGSWSHRHNRRDTSTPLLQLYALREYKSKFWDNRQTRGLKDQDRPGHGQIGRPISKACRSVTAVARPTRFPVVSHVQHNPHYLADMAGPTDVAVGKGCARGPLTVHLCGFSPVCRRMCTTSMYCALKGFCSRVQACQRHTNSFFSPWMCSLLMCYQEQANRGVSPASHPCRPLPTDHHPPCEDHPPNSNTSICPAMPPHGHY